GDTIHINHLVDDPDDPNGDNWAKYTGGGIGKSNGPDQVNGTEGNRRQEGGIYPDTEDIDGSGFLDRINDYFTKSFELSKTSEDAEYVAGETVKDGTPTGWRLYRIPLSHFTKIKTDGNIVWNEIRNIRLSITGADSQAVLQIAKIELVGNEWIELGVSSDTTGFVKDDSVFAVTIINTEDNAEEYEPPKGVEGEYDRINQIRSKEQSLVLKFNNLKGYHQGAAEKTLFELGGKRAQSYLTYDRMKMFIYGNSPGIGEDDTDVEFFMRFGKGDAYYEITQPVYEGWDESNKRNSIDLDLEWLTALKLANVSNVNKIRPTDTLKVWDNKREYIFRDANRDPTGKRIQIEGTPAISRIQYIRVGVRNKSNLPISGEVWLDELRMSGVKKDRGVAMRVQGKLNLADIGNIAMAYSRRDADFHILQERLGSNSTSEDFRINASLTLSKFLPHSWGLKIPFSMAYSNSIKQPKYHPQNEDILVTSSNITDSILTINNSVNFSTSVSKTTKSERKLIKYTLDRINTSFSAKRSVSSSFQIAENLNENFSGKLSYSLPFGKDNFVSPFKWLGKVPLIGSKLGGFHLYYTPVTLNANMSFKESLSQKTPRIGKKTENYNLGLTRNYGLDYKLTENLKSLKYNRSISSDMDDYRGYVWMAVRDLDPGIVTNSTESISAAYTPAVLEWLRPNFSYSAQYRWSKPIGSTIDGANISTGLNFSSNMNLSLTKLFELVYKPPAKATGRRTRDNRNNKQQEEEKKLPQKDNLILKEIHSIIKKINPVNIRYTSNLGRNGLGVEGTVPTGYKFGWLPDHGLPHSPQVGSNTGDWNHKQDISLSSGIKLTSSISTTFNYSQNISSKIDGSGGETRTLKRDMLPYGEQLEGRIPFPGWNLRWNGLQKLPFLNKIARSVSLEHSFRGSESRNWRMETVVPDPMPLFNVKSFIDEYGDNQRSSKIDASFSPLLSVTMQLNKGVSVTTRLNYSRSMDQQENGQTYKVDKSLSSSANYSHKGGLTIPLPFFDNVDVQNNVNFTLNFDLNENSTKTRNNIDAKFTKPKEISSWKTGLRISYSFTTRVSGGIIYEYRESDNFTTGKKIDRDFGFDIKIAISG
ncbi:MAG: cell surface protein SprA, partial [Candidatus Marinimicrobia bacterium]|nr:cell surface protein SprA [Candidatus Neomarinimicrobiota bacterium]